MSAFPTAAAVTAVCREERAKCVAVLIRLLGDIDLAEEAVQEAFVRALERWPVRGMPDRPGAWIITTARNLAVDRVRREGARSDKEGAAVRLLATSAEDGLPEDYGGAVADDRLRLMFTCCHPALAVEAQVALTLKVLGGLTTAEIARAFLTSETTMAQRLVRAKRKITEARIPYRVPPDHQLPERLASVLAVLYLVYNEGHVATAGDELGRVDLAAEAVRLARLVVELMPDEPEAMGLLALVLLTEARRPARLSDAGGAVPLDEQDRLSWDAGAIAEGVDLVERALRRHRVGPYQLQAAIAAVHAEAPTWDDTDWAEIVGLYDELVRIQPGSAVVALNRAMAMAMRDGAATGLAAVDAVAGLEGYHLWHAARADLLRRMDRTAEARAAYDAAIALTANGAERAFLESRRASLQP